MQCYKRILRSGFHRELFYSLMIKQQQSTVTSKEPTELDDIVNRYPAIREKSIAPGDILTPGGFFENNDQINSYHMFIQL